MITLHCQCGATIRVQDSLVGKSGVCAKCHSVVRLARGSYLIGENEGRSSLDAVRAAHQIPGLSLSNRTVVWGHSQGGQAALWTGGLAPDYAPELDLLGVTAAAPAADVKGLIGNLG